MSGAVGQLQTSGVVAVYPISGLHVQILDTFSFTRRYFSYFYLHQNHSIESLSSVDRSHTWFLFYFLCNALLSWSISQSSSSSYNLIPVARITHCTDRDKNKKKFSYNTPAANAVFKKREGAGERHRSRQSVSNDWMTQVSTWATEPR